MLDDVEDQRAKVASATIEVTPSPAHASSKTRRDLLERGMLVGRKSSGERGASPRSAALLSTLEWRECSESDMAARQERARGMGGEKRP